MGVAGSELHAGGNGAWSRLPAGPICTFVLANASKLRQQALCTDRAVSAL